MAHSNQHHGPDEREFGTNWVTSSRFLFYIQVICLFAFVFGCSINMYNSRYKGKPRVAVPESTQYSPKYKS